CAPRVLDSFPTRRSSDLGIELQPQAVLAQLLPRLDERARHVAVLDQAVVLRDARRLGVAGCARVARVGHRNHDVAVDRGLAPQRSEEHTSELQSLAYLVC